MFGHLYVRLSTRYSSWIISTYRRTTHGITITYMFIISCFRRAQLKQIESDQNVNDIASVSVPGSMKTSSDETEKSETSSYHSTSKDTER